MKRGWMVWIASIIALALGLFLESQFQWIGGAGGTGNAGDGEREILYWVAPMDPNYRRDGPGKSPMGMDLVPVYVGETGDTEEGVSISPVVENNLGVRTALVEKGPLWRRVNATGYISFDETRISHIHLRTQGWIERLLIEAEGERVEKGELLFELYSPDVVNAQKEYLQAQRRGESTLIAAADERLRALGVSREDIAALAKRGTHSETIGVVAPQSGIMAVLNVREGMHVMPATVIMSIADLSSVWLNAEVFESQVGWVDEHQPAEAQLSYLPGQVFQGSVDYVHSVLDPMARTLKVRLQFDNPGEILKPNMYAKVTIFGGPQRDVLSVPRESLIRSGDVDRVVLSTGEGRFQVQEVEIGIESGDWVEIRRGLSVGDRIVTSAQFLLDSEASISGSIRRLSDVEEEPDTGPIFASGVAKGISGRTLTLAHDPIDELGWPAMTMDFEVAEHVDLAGVKTESSLHFSLKKEDGGGYRIGMIHVMDNDPGEKEHDGMNNVMDNEPSEEGHNHD